MPSPAMIVALVALFFAMSGLGIAAKNMITGKQIENGTITSKDLAKGAVEAKNLGAGSVTTKAVDPTFSPDALDRGAGQSRGGTSASYFNICSNGVIVYANQPCFSIPAVEMKRYAKAENPEFSGFNLPGVENCGVSEPIPLSGISVYPDLAPVPDLDPTGDSLELLVKPNTVFTATARARWEAGPGSIRYIAIIHKLGPNWGANEGETISLASAGDVPSADASISQTATVDFTARNSDEIQFQAVQCGSPEGVDLQRLDVSVVPQATEIPSGTE